MKIPWFTNGATSAPARSGKGLTSTYAADRAEALAAQHKAAADELEKRTREINAQLARAKEMSAQAVAKAEAEAEATRKHVGEALLTEYYGTTAELVRAHLTEPTRGAALKLRDTFMQFRARALVELGVTQGTEYVGLAFASVLVAEAPASTTGFIGSDMTADYFAVSARGVSDPFVWEEEIDRLTRRLAARVIEYTARGYEVTDYHRDYFNAWKLSLTAGDRIHAIAAAEAAEAARKQAAFVSSYVAPTEITRRPPSGEYMAIFGDPR